MQRPPLAVEMPVVDMTYVKKLPHLELGHWVITFADALADHRDYQADGSIPHPLYNASALKELGTRFLDVVAAAETKHVDRVAERDALRPEVELRPALTAHWVVIRSVAEKNPGLIANLPLPLKKKPVKSSSSSSMVTAPRNPKVKHKGERTVVISTSKVDRARTYDVGVCMGDPSQDASWSILGPFDHCRSIDINDLEPGKLYYFKVRCFVGGVQSAWSDIVSIRVL